MSRESFQMMLNQSVQNFEEFKLFKQLVNTSCNDLSISSEDKIFLKVDSIQIKMKTFMEELDTTTDPNKRSKIITNLNSCRNQICTILQKLYLDNDNTTSTILNL